METKQTTCTHVADLELACFVSDAAFSVSGSL